MATEPGPAEETGDVRRDMETIFGAPQRPPGRETASEGRAIVPIVTARSSERFRRSKARAALFVPGLVVAGTVAVAIGLFQHGASNPTAPRSVKPVPAAAPQVAQARPAPVVAQAQAAPAAPAITPGTQPATEPAAAPPRAAVHERRALADLGQDRRAEPKPVRTVARRDDRDGCHRQYRMALARCMRPNIVDADRQLRYAYHDAVRAGVDRQTLIAYRRQWSSLRTQALSDPRGVAAGYRDIAQRLDAAHR